MMNNFWFGRRVLITGIAGFIGGHLARTLVDLSADVVGLDRLSDSPCLRVHGLSAKIPILVRDLAGDPERITSALASGNGEWRFEGACSIANWRPPEVVFHLAGLSLIDRCQADPLAAWEANVRGTWAVLEACRNLPAGQIRAVLCASSNHVYGSMAKPVDLRVVGVRPHGAYLESETCRQVDVYGMSKRLVDGLVETYGKSLGLRVASLRHVNGFGPGDPHTRHLVTATVLSLLRGEAPVLRSDGTPTKGYLYIDDIVSAYLTLAERLAGPDAGLSGRAFNAAPAAPVSARDVMAELISVSGLDVTPIVQLEPFYEAQSGYYEHLNSTALRRLGWAPAVALRDGLRQTLDWFRVHGGMAWAA